MISRRSLYRSTLFLVGSLLILPFLLITAPQAAEAAASLSVSSPGSVSVGQTVTVTIRVNTGGQSANAFEGRLSYPANLLEGVRGTYSGSICTLPITTPDPSGGSATFSCGTPSGYNGSGTVATVVFTAIAPGTASFGLSNCQVLANDGQGTDITGGCSGGSTTINGSSGGGGTPTPTPGGGGSSGGGTTTPRPTRTPTPRTSPTPRASGGPSQPVEAPNEATPEAEPTPPEAEPLPENAPNPEAAEETETVNTGRRTIGQAIQDLFSSLRTIGKVGGDVTGMLALLLAIIPVLGLSAAILFMVYRLYLLERRRRRTLDRLFEMELAELSALEGKLDLLGEKGIKGREQYRDEFRKSKENILRQIKPDFAKPVETAKTKAAEPEAKAEPDAKK